MAGELIFQAGDRVRFYRDDSEVWCNGFYGTVMKTDVFTHESVEVAFDDDECWRICSTCWLTKVRTPDTSSIDTIEEYLNAPDPQ